MNHANTDTRLRRLEVLTFVIVALLASLLVLGNNSCTKRTLAARDYRLLDDHGNVLAVLGISADSTTSLDLFDADGTLRARLGVLRDGSPGFAFYDDQGNSRISLGLLRNRTSTLAFTDAHGRTRARLATFDHEFQYSTSISFFDSAGHYQAGLGVDDIGATLNLGDRVRLVAWAHGSSSLLELTGTDGQPRAWLTAEDRGGAIRVVMSDSTVWGVPEIPKPRYIDGRKVLDDEESREE